MPVQAFRITGVEARRYRGGNTPSQVRIDHNTTVLTIRPRGDDRADVEFRYTVTYTGLGMIQFEGEVTYQGRTSGDAEVWSAQTLLNEWEAKHRMPDGIAEEVHNVILAKGSFEVLILAQKLNLPPPVKVEIPRVKFGKGRKGQNKSFDGPEVA